LAAVAALAILAGCGAPTPKAATGSPSPSTARTDPPKPAADDGQRSTKLAAELLQAVRQQNFRNVIDKNTSGLARQVPNVDVTVIELATDGRALSTADALLSPRYPDGIVVPLDKNLATDKVRWRYWNDAEWDGHHGQGTRDVLSGRQSAPIDYMSPYPASILKLMVGFGILKLVDRGQLSLEQNYSYRPDQPDNFCGGSVTRKVRQFFDDMITVSSDASTCALIQVLRDHGGIDALNNQFSALGMPTLKLVGGFTGSNMGALDTAKLLLIIAGGPGTLWTAPAGKAVTAAELSPASRKFFLSELGDQGLNQVLSTTNWCGRDYPAPGIPQVTPKRWINSSNGTVTADGRFYGRDVRPCNEKAEVTYAHKTGLVVRAGGDAGIVHSLPGKPGRNYIIVVQSHLGTRYTDQHRPADPSGVYPVAYSQKFGQLGLAVDRIVTAHHND
jgi:hypothetical protein